MEVYEAIADFVCPTSKPYENTGSYNNILKFCKGDQFEIFHSGTLTQWWGARALKDSSTGYVPAKYMKYVKKLNGSDIPKNYIEEKEKKIKHFEDMQNSFYPNHPPSRSVNSPAPDYDNDDFVRKFESVLSNADIDNIYIPEPEPEPEPDYNEDESDSFPPPPPPITDTPSNNNSLEMKLNGQPKAPVLNVPPEEDCPQISPKKLENPCLRSNERQALHKELLFNYKRGVNVLQKPELNKILEKRKEQQRLKEWENQHTNKRTSLELKLEERANRMKEEENGKMNAIKEKNENAPEFLKMHSKITQKSPVN